MAVVGGAYLAALHPEDSPAAATRIDIALLGSALRRKETTLLVAAVAASALAAIAVGVLAAVGCGARRSALELAEEPPTPHGAGR